MVPNGMNRPSTTTDGGDDDCFIHHQDVHPFGTGIKRKRIAFVPASEATTTTAPEVQALQAKTTTAGDRYLSIVLAQERRPQHETQSRSSDGHREGETYSPILDTSADVKPLQGESVNTRGFDINATRTDVDKRGIRQSDRSSEMVVNDVSIDINIEDGNIAIGGVRDVKKMKEDDTIGVLRAKCDLCGMSTAGTENSVTQRNHESSIVHQVCLQHSHPPSHLDRERLGLKYLASYGWDPDSRKGLGVAQEGIRIPIKTREKRDTAGLTISTFEEDDIEHRRKRKTRKEPEGEGKRLNAKEMRVLDVESKKKAEKLRLSFYGDDLSRFLGTEKTG